MCVKSAHLNLKASGINTASVQYYGDYIKGVDLRMILEFLQKKFSKRNPEFKNHSKINNFYIITLILDRCCVDTRCFEVQMRRFHAHFFSYRCPTSDYPVLLAKSWLRHSRGIFYFYQSFISVICFHRHDNQTKQRRILKSELCSSSCQQFVVDSTGPCCQP